MSQDWIDRMADFADVCDRRAAQLDAEATDARQSYGDERRAGNKAREAAAWKARAGAARNGQLLHDPNDLRWSYDHEALIAEATSAGHVVYPDGFGA